VVTGTPVTDVKSAASSSGGSLQRKPKKLVALQYNYGDSDTEETREERKIRLVCIELSDVCRLLQGELH